MNCAVWLVSAILLVGCQTKPAGPPPTVIRPPVVEKQAAFEGNTQDAGIKKYEDGKGFLISVKALGRYNALIARYGKDMVPPIGANEGVVFEGDNIYMTAEGMTYFVILSQRLKRGQ